MRPLRRNPEGRGFPGDLLCRAVRPWGLPWASRRFVHLIPESRRRGHAGLIQRFLSLWRWAAMALGIQGALLGWLPPVRSSVRARAAKVLAAYMAAKP